MTENKDRTKPFLQSEHATLVPLQPEADAPEVMRWLNDPEVTYFMFYGQRPLNLSRAQKFLEAQDDSNVNIVFMICDRKRGNKIGLAGLYGIDWIARRAEFRILIGDKNMWGKGYGTEVTELLTWFGFDRLNLRRVDLGVTAENKGAIKAYAKAGYAHECTRKDFLYRNGRYYAVHYMAIYRDEYDKKFAKAHAARFCPQRSCNVHR